MADLSVTEANVKPGAGITETRYTAGETLTAGQPVYKDSSDGKLYKATAAGSASQADVIGIVTAGNAADQPVLATGKTGTLKGMSTTEGLFYCLSGTAGGISPHTDATTPASSEYAVFIGTGDADGNLLLNIHVTQQQVA